MKEERREKSDGMINVEHFDFKSSYFENLNFNTQPCAFPNPVDIWLNNYPLVQLLTETIFPNKKFDSIYEVFVPYTAEAYIQNLPYEGKDIPIFAITCVNNTFEGITVDIKFEKDKVIWENWKVVNKNPFSFPKIIFEKNLYLKTIRKLDRFAKRKIKKLTAYRHVDDALGLFIEAEDFSINITDMDRYRRIETNAWPLKLDVDEYGEVIFCEWDLTTAKNYPSDVMEYELRYLINEKGLWIPGTYQLGNYKGNFWEITYILIQSMKTP